MKITITPPARALIRAHGQAVTVTSFVISSCCAPELPPEVRPGAPAEPEDFRRLPAEDITVYYDTLLALRDEMVIDVEQYGPRQELTTRGWQPQPGDGEPR